MIKSRIFCLVFFAIFWKWNSVVAQIIEDINSSSAGNVNSGGVIHALNQPDLSSGALNINIPITNLNSYDFSLPIALTYNTSGIKVDQQSGSIGLGWNLEVGGSISRNVLGIPDDAYFYSDNQEDYKANGGFFYNTSPIFIEYTTDINGNNFPQPQWEVNRKLKENALGKKVLDNTCDMQSDEYYINAPGLSGMFVYDKTIDEITSVISLTPVIIPFKPYKIEKVDHSDHSISFVITNESGFKYFFTTQQKVTNSITGLDYALSFENQDLKQKTTYVTDWKLDKIEDNNGRVLYTFEYTENPIITKTQTMTHFYNSLQEFGNIQWDYRINFTEKKKTKYLSTINYQGGKVYFHYGYSRCDIIDEQYLKEITFWSNNNIIEPKRFRLGYSYFENIDGDKKLKLDNVWEHISENSSKNIYSFEYDNRMPIRGNPVDFWGYYNGYNNYWCSLFPTEEDLDYCNCFADRYPNPSYTQAGILNKIIYPTGGFEEFHYENHDFSKFRSNNLQETDLSITGGLRIKKIVTSDGDNDISNNLVKYYQYRLPNLNEVSSGYLINQLQFDHNGSDASFGFCSSNNNSILNGKNGIVAYRSVNIFDCDIEVYPNCDVNSGKTQVKFYYSASSEQEILNYNYNTGLLSTVYSFAPSTNPFYINHNRVYPNYLDDKPFLRSLPIETNIYDGEGHIISKEVNTYAISDHNSRKCFGYKVSGSEIYTICPPDYCPPWWDYTRPYIGGPYGYLSEWIYLSKKENIVYKPDLGISTIDYNYANPNHIQITSVHTINQDGSEVIQEFKYPMDFNPANDPFDNSLGATNSDEKIIRNFINKNTLNIPLLQTRKIKNAGSSFFNYISILFAQFKDFQNTFGKHFILPFQNLEVYCGKTIDSNLQFPAFNLGNWTYDPKFITTSRIEEYYFQGSETHSTPKMVKTLSNENHLKQYKLYRGDDNFEIAKSGFCQNPYIDYDSFEYKQTLFESNRAIPISFEPSAVTGLFHGKFNAGQNLEKSNIPNGKYVISFWSDVLPILTVSDISIISTRNDDINIDISGWRYNEYLVSADEGNNLFSINGPINIDEFRIYSNDASLSTTTFNINNALPSSTCDENNQISHFEYDEFKRIKYVKNKDGKIVKGYDYNFPIETNFIPPSADSGSDCD
jgi:hypothetical protein